MNLAIPLLMEIQVVTRIFFFATKNNTAINVFVAMDPDVLTSVQ